MRQMAKVVRKLQPGGAKVPMTLFGFNSGYAYLFENWALGCAANGIEMRDRTIVISDDASRPVVEAAGYTMPEERVYGLDTLCTGGHQMAATRSRHQMLAARARAKCEKPATSFALWPHQAWMAAWIVAAHDLVLLGHDVLMLDVGIVSRTVARAQPVAVTHRCVGEWRYRWTSCGSPTRCRG